MAYNYAPKAEKARKQIEKYGRSVVFVQMMTDRNDADPLAGPLSSPVVSDPVPAVFVYPSGDLNLGISQSKAALFRSCEQMAILGSHDIVYENQTYLTELDGTQWKIEVVDRFQPGDTAILYFVGMVKP